MKPSKKMHEQAQDLMLSNGFKQIIVNKKGEFFTDMGLALMSVDREKKNLATIKFENKDLEAEYEKKVKALSNCTSKLEELKTQSTEGMTQEQIANNQVVQTKLDKRIKLLEGEVKKMSNQIKAQ